jgi:hypothetical protein
MKTRAVERDVGRVDAYLSEVHRIERSIVHVPCPENNPWCYVNILACLDKRKKTRRD